MLSSAMLRTLSATASVSVKTAKIAPSAPARSSPALTSVSRTVKLPAKGLRPMLAQLSGHHLDVNASRGLIQGQALAGV